MIEGQIPATLIPGDGIGPEVMESVVQVLDALGHRSPGTFSTVGSRRLRSPETPCRGRRWRACVGPS